MKSIKLHIDDPVFNDLEVVIRAKRLDGKFSRAVDEMVILAIIEAIKNNQEERTLRYRSRYVSVVDAIGK